MLSDSGVSGVGVGKVMIPEVACGWGCCVGAPAVGGVTGVVVSTGKGVGVSMTVGGGGVSVAGTDGSVVLVGKGVDGICVGVLMGVQVAVAPGGGVQVGVAEGPGVQVGVKVTVGPGVKVGVFVDIGVGVAVGAKVGVDVCVGT